MLLGSTLQFVLFLAIVHSVDPKELRTARQGSSSLDEVVENLSIVARVVNGIALQEGLSSGSVKHTDVIKELLHVESGDGLETLKTVDVKGTLAEYRKLAKNAGNVAQSPVDPDRMQDALQLLATMTTHLSTLQAAETMHETEWLTRATKAGAVRGGQSLFNSKILKFGEDFKSIFNRDTSTQNGQNAVMNAFDSMKEDLNLVITDTQSLETYQQVLKVPLSMIGAYDALKPLEILLNVSEQFKQETTKITALSTDLSSLNSEFTSLDPFFNEIASIQSTTKNLDNLVNATLKTSSSKHSKKKLTVGMRKGAGDVATLVKSVESEWFRKKVANGKRVDGLKSHLNPLQTFGAKVLGLQNTLGSFRKQFADTSAIKSMRELLQTMTSNSLDATELTSIKSSTGDVTNCLKNLKAITNNVDVAAFRTAMAQIKLFDEQMKKVKGNLQEAKKLKLYNEEFFDAFRNFTSKFTHGVTPLTEYLEEAKKFVKVSINSEALSKFSKAHVFLSEVKTSASKCEQFWINKKANWDEISGVKNVLASTNLLTSLQCLQSKQFDAAGITKVVKFGASVRAIGERHGQGTSTVDFLNAVSSIKSGLLEVEKTVPKAARSRRAARSDWMMENSKSLAHDFGQGVSLLDELARVHRNRKTMKSAADSVPEVVTFINARLQGVWTSEFPAKFHKMSTDLADLEVLASKSKNGELEQMGKVMEKASGIQGVPIDTRLLNEPLIDEMKADSAVSGAAPTFETLASLQLDFSSHHSELKTASFSLASIRQYFDKVFGNSRALGDEEVSNEKTSTILIVAGTVFAVLMTGAFGVIVYFVVRKIMKKRAFKKLQQEERDNLRATIKWLYQRFSKLGEWNVNSASKEQYQPLHHAILSGNKSLLADCVEKRANVNSYCRQRDGFFATPLHLCVQKNLPEFVDILLKNGANPYLYDSQHKTVWDRVKEMADGAAVKAVFVENGGEIDSSDKLKIEVLPRKTPAEFSLEEFRVFFPTEKSSEEIKEDRKKEDDEKQQSREELLEKKYPGYKEMKQKYAYQITDNYSNATHIIVPVNTTDQKTFHLEKNKTFFLNAIFSGRHLMCSTWIQECIKSPEAFHQEMSYLVDEIRHKDVKLTTYKTILESVHNDEVPLLAGTEVVAYASFDASGLKDDEVAKKAEKRREKWKAEERLAMRLGATSFRFSPMIYLDESAPFESMFHRDDKGSVIVLCREADKAQMRFEWWYIFGCNRYTILTVDEFYDFLLAFEKRNYRNGADKDEKTIEKWELAKDPEGERVVGDSHDTFINDLQEMRAVDEEEKPMQPRKMTNYRLATVGHTKTKNPANPNQHIFRSKFLKEPSQLQLGAETKGKPKKTSVDTDVIH